MAKRKIAGELENPGSTGATESSELDKQNEGSVATLEKPEGKKEKEWQVPLDPKIRVRIVNLDLVNSDDENVPWSFAFRRPSIQRPDGTTVRFQTISYPLKDGGEYELAESVVIHLESIAYPVKKYKSGQEEGQAMLETKSRRRFTVSRL